MPSAYIRLLQRSLEAEAAPQQKSGLDLKHRFLAWFDSQPEISRIRPYAMIELEQALGTPGWVLGPVLMSLGWTRHRKWSGSGPFVRFWLPPSN